jgi:hypothetical protein
MSKKPKSPAPSNADLTDALLKNLLPGAAVKPEGGKAPQPEEQPAAPPEVADAHHEVEDSQPEPTITLPPVPAEPTMEGFSMEDAPSEGASTAPDGLDLGQLVREAAARPVAVEDYPPAVATIPAPKPLEGELSRGTGLRYESRIEILDAFQYPGNVAKAPVWVDRNWIGWADMDDTRGIPAGPCLRVPTFRGDVVLCRPGDYVCRQSVKITDDSHEIRLEVWTREQFERLFLPSPSPTTGSKSEAA